MDQQQQRHSVFITCDKPKLSWQCMMAGSSPAQHITDSGVRVVKSYFDDIRLHVEVQSQRDAEKLFNYLYERRHGNE
jgi:hypothetical protein